MLPNRKQSRKLCTQPEEDQCSDHSAILTARSVNQIHLLSPLICVVFFIACHRYCELHDLHEANRERPARFNICKTLHRTTGKNISRRHLKDSHKQSKEWRTQLEARPKPRASRCDHVFVLYHTVRRVSGRTSTGASVLPIKPVNRLHKIARTNVPSEEYQNLNVTTRNGLYSETYEEVGRGRQRQALRFPLLNTIVTVYAWILDQRFHRKYSIDR